MQESLWSFKSFDMDRWIPLEFLSCIKWSFSDWYLDMGVSAYMTPDLTILDFSKQYVGKDNVVILWLGSLQLLQKLCTRSLLCSCNFLSLDQSFCPFYNTVIETSDHMLIHCQFAWTLWAKFFFWWGIFRCVPHILDELLN